MLRKLMLYHNFFFRFLRLVHVISKWINGNISCVPTMGFQSIEIAKKVFVTFDNVFHVYLMRGFRNMEEIEFSGWLFEGRPRQGKNVLTDGPNWLRYFAGSSKSHHENSISCIFLESRHQVDMKNVVKCYKHFFCYFNALKTHCDIF